jgi:hypothetical protein
MKHFSNLMNNYKSSAFLSVVLITLIAILLYFVYGRTLKEGANARGRIAARNTHRASSRKTNLSVERRWSPVLPTRKYPKSFGDIVWKKLNSLNNPVPPQKVNKTQAALARNNPSQRFGNFEERVAAQRASNRPQLPPYVQPPKYTPMTLERNRIQDNPSPNVYTSMGNVGVNIRNILKGHQSNRVGPQIPPRRRVTSFKHTQIF